MKRKHYTDVIAWMLILFFAAILWFLTFSPQISGILCALVLLPLLSLCANVYVRRHISVSFTVPPVSAKCSDLRGSLVISNESVLPAAKLYCTVKIRNDLTLEEEKITFTASAGAARSSEREFSVRSMHCGRLHVSMESLKIADYSGIFLLDIPVGADAMVTVMPDLFVSDVEINTLFAADDDGTADAKGEDRSEVFSLREYVPGDDVRQIHRKLSGKMDKLIVREPSRNVSRSMLVFWDTRERCSADVTDALAESVASVSRGILDCGIHFDLGHTQADECIIRPITNEEELLECIAEILTQRGNEDLVCGDFSGYGRVIVFTSAVPEGDIPEHMFYFVCCGTSREDKNLLAFTPQDYMQILERPEL